MLELEEAAYLVLEEEKQSKHAFGIDTEDKQINSQDNAEIDVVAGALQDLQLSTDSSKCVPKIQELS